MGYSKYGWAASQISEKDMSRLYHLKKTTRKHITVMVAEAVKLYLSRHVHFQDTSPNVIIDKEGEGRDSN